MLKICIWCQRDETQINFVNKAHSIPKSLGGQNFNKNVCDECNSFFGEKIRNLNYSIEEALKETFCVSRERLLNRETAKKKVGNFKSRFFDIKTRNGKNRLIIKSPFFLNLNNQLLLCRNFKRGLIKLWFEEYTRQNPKIDPKSKKYNSLRNFSRYDIGEIPILYFERAVGMMILFQKEAETPILFFERNLTYISDENYTEFEFLGHVFGFPFENLEVEEVKKIAEISLTKKQPFFKACIQIRKVTDIDFTLKIFDE